MHCKTLYIGQSGGEVGVVMQSVYSLHVIVSGYQTILPQDHLRQGHTFTFFNMGIRYCIGWQCEGLGTGQQHWQCHGCKVSRFGVSKATLWP